LNFLDMLEPTARERFTKASSSLELPAGEFLIRRGDPGGDVFLVESGALEVLDTRGGNQSILGMVRPGGVVGELSFLDDSPRSADVRATRDSRLRRWARKDMLALMQRNPSDAARVYDALARTVAHRLRKIVRSAALDDKEAVSESATQSADGLTRDALRIAERAKAKLHDADVAARENPGRAAAKEIVRSALDRLEGDLHDVFSRPHHPERGRQALRRVRRELRPWLARSTLGERCLREFSDATVTPQVVQHMLEGEPEGEGVLGRLIDKWFLTRPTMVDRREADLVVTERLVDGLSDRAGRAVLVLDSAAQLRIERLSARLSSVPSVLWAVDPGREVLVGLETEAERGPQDVTLRTYQDNIAHIALGRSKFEPGGLDAVGLYDVLSYMPDRIALGLIEWLRERLNPDARVVMFGLSEAADADMLGRLLRWTTIRRNPTRTRRLLEGAGLVVVREVMLSGPGYVMEAVSPAD
jgi:CRP-like cAMP-binding protein